MDLVRGNYMMEVSRDRTYENLVEWEDRVEAQIKTDDSIDETEKYALVLARRGQGKYRVMCDMHLKAKFAELQIEKVSFICLIFGKCLFSNCT